MSNSFRTIQDILDASRHGDSLYSIYQALKESEALLKERQKNAFQLLFEILIPSLTEKQAQELAMFPTEFLEIYITTISLPIAQALSLFKGYFLFLNKVQYLEADVASKLAQYKGWALRLNGLQQIDEVTAKALSQWQWETNASFKEGHIVHRAALSLNGLKQLNEATAKAFSPFKGEFSLNGLQEIDEVTLKALAFSKSWHLHLEGLKQLNESTAKMLAQYQGLGLHLNGLQNLEESSAKALVRFQGYSLYLNGLKQIDEATAKALCQFRGSALSLEGLQFLEKIEKILFRFKGGIYINNTVNRKNERLSDQGSVIAKLEKNGMIF